MAITYETRRRITDKYGRRYSDDMIGVTANAACSIALRNAVFKGVPKAFWAKAYEQAVRTYRGDQQTLGQRRGAMIDYFKKSGIAEDRVLAKIGKPSIEAIDLDDLVRLKGFATAIKEGDATIEETFPPVASAEPAAAEGKTRSEQLAQKLRHARQPDTGEPAGEKPAAESAVDAVGPVDEAAGEAAMVSIQHRNEFLAMLAETHTVPECEQLIRGAQNDERLAEADREEVVMACNKRVVELSRAGRGRRADGALFDAAPSAVEEGL